MFKSPLTRSQYQQFVSDYQSVSNQAQSKSSNMTTAFVYVDKEHVRLVTDVMDELSDEGVFAVSIAEDGWMELLAVSE